jgi:hypothetical protein
VVSGGRVTFEGGLLGGAMFVMLCRLSSGWEI